MKLLLLQLLYVYAQFTSEALNEYLHGCHCTTCSRGYIQVFACCCSRSSYHDLSWQLCSYDSWKEGKLSGVGWAPLANFSSLFITRALVELCTPFAHTYIRSHTTIGCTLLYVASRVWGETYCDCEFLASQRLTLKNIYECDIAFWFLCRVGLLY